MLKIADRDFSYTAEVPQRLIRLMQQVWSTMLLQTEQKLLNTAISTVDMQTLRLTRALTRALDNARANTTSYQAQLKIWLGDKLCRDYQYWFEVLLALDGWIQSAACREDEIQFAKVIYKNPYLDTLLNTLIYKLYLKLV